jgi:GntR family transcriptional regulator/MocR family aminotransferase
MDYGDPAGYRPLREAIAGYLRNARAVACTADQVMVVSGTQHALDLAARVLLDPGETAWVEDPGYIGTRSALMGAGVRVKPVPVDSEGFNVARAERHHPGARLCYVTPSHQYPLGVTMSLPRRLALLDWARRCNAWIVEDDYDSEFRYAGRPLAALQGLDRDQRVLYVGTFSKVLFPALRLGYLVAPPDLIGAFVAARALADHHPPSLTQAILADFIADGHLARHVRRMRTLYAERQLALLRAVRRELGGCLSVAAAEAGLHVVGWLADGVDDRAASRRAAACGVEAPPLSAYRLEQGQRGGLLLGYAATSPRQIRDGVRGLAAALRQ